MSVEMTNKPDIDDILNVLSPESRESLYVLSVPNLLNNLLAEKMLISTGKANGNSQMLIEELRSFPIWHDRTIKTWVFDDDIREYALEKLNGSGIEIRQKVLATMKEHRKELENVLTLDIEDFDLQIARLSLGIEESRKEGIQKFRQIFDISNRYNLQETERVIDLYIEEKFPKSYPSDEPLTEELSNVYFMRGLYAYKHNNFAKAISFLLLVWKKMSESDESMKDAAISAHLVGRIWSRERSRWIDAEDAYKQSLELGKDNLHHKVQVYHSFGNLLSKERKRWIDAEDAYKQSLELLEKINDPFGKAQVYHSLGNLLSKERKRWADAEDAYKQSLELEEKINNPFGKAKVYHSFGNLLSKERKRWADAEDAYKQSLELLEKINDPFGKAKVYHSFGNLLSKERKRWEEAEDAYKESLELLKKINDPFGQAQVYHSLGNLLSKERNRWEEAEDAYKESLELGKDNLHHKAQVYHSLGNLLSKERKRRGEAEDAYKESLELLEKVNDQRGLSMVSTSYGRFLINKEDFDNAKIYLKKALDNEKKEFYRKKILNLLENIKNN